MSDVLKLIVNEAVAKEKARNRRRREPPSAVPFIESSVTAIEVVKGEHSKATDACEAALIKAGIPVYQWGNALSRPIIEQVDAARGRKTTAVRIIPYTAPYLADQLCKVASFQRYDARLRDLMPIDPPSLVINALLAREGDWRFPTLKGVLTAPTMREDGSLLTDPGYDSATQMLLIDPPPMLPVSSSKEDAIAALDLFVQLIRGFPFVSDIDRAVAISGLITPVVRAAFPTSPLHVASAPTAGTGKSYLWDLASLLVSGRLMPVVAQGGVQGELEKRLNTQMLKGAQLVSMDNVNGELGGDTLSQFLTQERVDIRLFGNLRDVTVVTRGTSLFATGNNIVVTGDLPRRTLQSRLDAGVERPELRKFDFDPVAEVVANRGKYISAALTICKAYHDAGRPGALPQLLSFGGWSDTVRSALVWLGMADPAESIERIRAEDPNLIELAEVLDAWSAAFGIGFGSRKRAKDAIELSTAEEREDTHAELKPRHKDLLDAFEGIALRSSNGKNKALDAKTLGEWLRLKKDKPIGGICLRVNVNPKRGNEWYVAEL
jgi:hypothetical protein